MDGDVKAAVSFEGHDATQAVGANGRRRELKVSLPGGISFSLRGFDVVLMIVAATMPLMAYFMWEMKENGNAEHAQIAEAIEVQSYILTLSQEKREALNLAMPESIRKRTVEERRRLREAREARERVGTQ